MRRSNDNARNRTNERLRHDPFNYDENGVIGTGQSFLNPTDLEWMSLNYRKQRAARMSPSRRRMILVMLEEDYQYFPSLLEIREELKKAHMKHLETES